MKALQNSGNINAILHLMALNQKRTPETVVQQALGVLNYYYYCYLHEYHCLPKDLRELVDGILYLEVVKYSEKYYYELRQTQENQK